MQIITGKYRARKLIPVPATTTRPTLARVKESIFNLIASDIPDSIVLDLFAGSGAFGAECISRAAKKVYFVDSELLATKTIIANTKNMTEDFEIIKLDYLHALEKFAEQKIQFDIIYLDPPYKSNFATISMQKIAESGLLAPNGKIIVEHESEKDLQNVGECYIMKKQRKYGIAYVSIFEQKG